MSIRTKFGIHGQVNECDNAQGTLARLTHFGQNGGWDESRGARVFVW